MSKSLIHVVFPALVLSVIVTGCERGKGPASPPGQMAVTVVTLKSGPITLTRELPGRTTAYLVADVRPQVTGIVEQRLFTEGALVQAGQPLYQLDDATWRADVASATATLARAGATLDVAHLNAERVARLVTTGAVSKQDHDTASATEREARADVAVARAELQRANVALEHAHISAPISGRIGKSTVTQGALVTANQEAALATVQQLDPIYVDVTQSSNELLELRRGLAAGSIESTATLPVTILLEDNTRYPHEGSLAFSEVTVDPSTGSYALRVLVPNPDQILLPGMYVRAVIGAGVRRDAVLVPQQGIQRDPRGDTTALVVSHDGKVEVRRVRVSHTIGDQWLVEEGLAAGDRVIVEGVQKIGPGMPVQAIEAGTETPAAAAPAAAAH